MRVLTAMDCLHGRVLSFTMHHILLMLLLGVCSLHARPLKDLELLLPYNYRQLYDALQRSGYAEPEIMQGYYYDKPMSRSQREVNTIELPDKRIPRIGGTIVMGRKK
ncbi:hypothetical protein GCK32_009941 [Trichostrongylus colubriformis]|uniref:Uncharacterized protein n=1 Tax=Trichostrongylus colubriformis TaxID=6319 RepID=A0AAN8IVX9_TRICO